MRSAAPAGAEYSTIFYGTNHIDPPNRKYWTRDRSAPPLRQRRASRRTCAARRTKRQTKPIEVQLSTGWLVPTPKGSAARFHAQRNEQLSSVAEKWLRARG